MADFDHKHGTRLFSKDKEFEGKLVAYIDKFGFDEIFSLFPLFIRRTWLKKFLAHFELFSRVKDIDGDVVELGVFRGLSLISFAMFNEFFKTKKRKIYGIDNFAGFTELTEFDGKKYDVPKFVGGFSPESFYGELMDIVKYLNKKFDMTEILVLKGNVEEIVPDIKTYSRELSLIHFDVDLYIPTKAGLENLYPMLVDKGIAVFDEYGQMEWSGETRAVDEFFEDKDVQLRKFYWQPAPAAYIVKENVR